MSTGKGILLIVVYVFLFEQFVRVSVIERVNIRRILNMLPSSFFIPIYISNMDERVSSDNKWYVVTGIAFTMSTGVSTIDIFHFGGYW